MKTIIERKGDVLTVRLNGGMDERDAINLKGELLPSLDGVKTLYIDMTDLKYICIDGLRTIFAAQAVMNRQGYLIVCHAAPNVMAFFEMAGLKEFMIFE